MSQPVLVCGLGRVGQRILDHLKAAGIPVSVLSTNEASESELNGASFVKGDCRRPELLEKAGVKSARGVIIVTSDDLVNITTAMLVRQMNPDVRIVVRMFNQNLLPRLGAAVKNTVALSVSALTAPMMALTALTGETLGAFNLEGKPQQIAEVLIDEHSRLLGESLTDVAENHRLTVLSHSVATAEPQLWRTLNPQAKLAVGDRFVASGSPEAIAPLLSEGDSDLGGARWASWIRRQIRLLFRTIGSIDLPVRLASFGLVLTLFLSTLTFRYGLNTDWADGLYQTVSIVATGGDLNAGSRPPWAKVFISILKVAGAALLAIFTAIFTQYFIRAKLGSILESRRIPDGGHIVVCGLGNVGFRCVEELIRLGQPVVAIESVNDNPFAETVRRLGGAVVIGDATVEAVLKQSGATTAKAVIAATESELRNLEIALLVRELKPNLRVVVRLAEPTFAQAARDSANIKHAVSVPALAAPAFVAGLYGDRVQTLITIGSQPLAVVEVAVQPNDPGLNEHTIDEVANQYGILPLGGERSRKLKAGDKLTLIAELPSLERLVRRDIGV